MNKNEICSWIDNVKNKGGFEGNRPVKSVLSGLGDLVFPESINDVDNNIVFLARSGSKSALIVAGSNAAGFDGEKIEHSGIILFHCPLSHNNAEILRKVFPYTAPSPLADKNITFGLGDRLGIASPGHIRLFNKKNACPVLAQQSVRELELTGRNYEEVLDCATFAVFQEGYRKPWGADGDHLKTEEWVKKALNIGFTMITADVSDFIRKEYDSADQAKVMDAYNKLDKSYREDIEKRYLELELKLDTGDVITFNRGELAKIVLVYKDAVDHAFTLYKAGAGKAFDFELSVDETETPTLPQAHVFAAMESINRGIKISSLAPRFIGEFQKGIDYIGNSDEFEKAFIIHAAIARHFGYRVSIHSGSDKFTVFPAIGKHTNLKFHVKTAGTNWLQAVEVISQHNPDFFRKLYKTALEVFPIAKQYYHITPDMSNLPDLEKLGDNELPSVLKNDDARQVIHVTYGEMLRRSEFHEEFFKILNENIEEYWLSLEKHIGKHFELLGV